MSMNTNTIKRCPFCGVSLKKIGNKRRGSQFYIHDYKGPDCILKEFSFKADDEEKIKQWNTRKPMQNIVERLEIKLSDTVYEKATQESNESHLNGLSMGYCEAIGIVKEEGGIDERN